MGDDVNKKPHGLSEPEPFAYPSVIVVFHTLTGPFMLVNSQIGDWILQNVKKYHIFIKVSNCDMCVLL